MNRTHCPKCGEKLDSGFSCKHGCTRAGLLYTEERIELAELRAENKRLREALEFYANPENYHAMAFLYDPPCGGFAEDFSDAGHEDYDRPMPGKTAREALGGK